jgi:enediyne biosynthesis protein E4
VEAVHSAYLRSVRLVKFLLSSLLAAATIAVAVPSAPAAEGDFRIRLISKSSTEIRQGESLAFEVVAQNETDWAQEMDVTFVIRPQTRPLEEVTFQRIRQTVLPGNSFKVRLRVAPGAWFAGTGRYEVAAQDDTSVVPMAFDVMPSKVRIPRFEDVTEQSGLATTLGDFPCGSWSAGAAWGDLDNDGDLDLFLPRQETSSHLFINDGTGHFTDEAATRGVAGALGISALAGDYDNDDDLDVYVTTDGPNRLLRNDGKGFFEDVADAAGVAGNEVSQSASWGDYDRDGHLDLYVANHVDCGADGTKWVAQPDSLYHSNGDGTFEDRIELLHRDGSTFGAGFQATWFDYDDDGDSDLFLANDFVGVKPEPNFLWRNDGLVDGDWRFTNVSVDAGVAIRMNSMGVGVLDYDRDLDLDFAVSNIRAPALMQNQGDGTFVDVAKPARLIRSYHDASSLAITWGVVAADFNNDAWEDLYFPSGRLRLSEMQQPMDYQPNEMYTNGRNGRFLDHSAASGAADTGHSRSAVLADFDRDGRIDIFSVNQNGAPRLYRNVTAKKRHHWLQVDVRGRRGNTRACGARAVVKIREGRLVREVMCGSVGFASTNDTVLHFGLGSAKRIQSLTITWPSGAKKVRRDLTGNQRVKVMEPSG